MSELISQDELDGLLAGMVDDSSDASSPAGGGLTPDLESLAGEIGASLQSAATGIGVMVAAESSLGSLRENMRGQGDVEAEFSDGKILFRLGLKGAVSGSLFLFLPEGAVAKIVAAAMQRSEKEITFSDEDLDSVKELIGPTLIAVSRGLSGKMGSQISTDPLEAIHMQSGGAFPLHDDSYLTIQGSLSIEGIMEDDLSLLLSASLANDILSKTSGGSTEMEAEASMPAASSPSSSASASPKGGEAKGRMKGQSSNNLSLLLDVQMPLTVELGRTRMYIKEILSLGEGSILELDKLAGEPVDLMVNSKLIARGEVVVIDENFGVRVTDIVSPSQRLKMNIL